MALLVFLDIDGCLRRNSAPKYQLESDLLENLAQFVGDLEKKNRVELVITSTWKTAFTVDEIRSHFPPSLRLKIVGVTPSFPAQDGSRYREISAYLKDKADEGWNWFAIDDDPLGFPQDLVNLILCDPANGFQYRTPKN